MPLSMARECRDLRRDLVRYLSVSLPVGAVIRGRLSADDVAKELGVSPKLITEAAQIGRLAAANAATSHTSKVPFFVPKEIHPYLVREARRVYQTDRVSQVMRALLHAAMQTTYEPVLREWSDHAPATGADRGRPATHVARHRIVRNNIATYLILSRGLVEAINARAAAYGTRRTRRGWSVKTRHSYMVSLATDFVDGLTKKAFEVEPIAVGDMFPRGDNYVLPVLRAAEELPEVLPSKTA